VRFLHQAKSLEGRHAALTKRNNCPFGRNVILRAVRCPPEIYVAFGLRAIFCHQKAAFTVKIIYLSGILSIIISE
jgi:hypothetical protein